MKPVDTPLTGVYRTAGHRPYFTPDAPSHLKIGGKHTKTRLASIPLPPVFPDPPPNNFSLTAVGRFGIFTASPLEYLVLIYDWESTPTDHSILSSLQSTEGGVPYSFALCPDTIEVRYAFHTTSLSQISTLFTQRHKKWLISLFPPHVAGTFIDRTLPLTHRIITPTLSHLWTKV